MLWSIALKINTRVLVCLERERSHMTMPHPFASCRDTITFSIYSLMRSFKIFIIILIALDGKLSNCSGENTVAQREHFSIAINHKLVSIFFFKANIFLHVNLAHCVLVSLLT